MKLLLSFSLLASCLSLTHAACQANNCVRAVTGTQRKEPNQSARREECSAVQRYTLTPATTTSTIYTTVTPTTVYLTATAHVTDTTGTLTVTQTLTAPNKRELERRQSVETPTSVPAYASACDGIAEYRSACSCWGVTATTITVPSPTGYTTITITTTATSTVTETLTATVPAATETAVTCAPGLSSCSAGKCKDLQSDPNNCGACNTVCGASAPVCLRGRCIRSNPNCAVSSSCTTSFCGSSQFSCYCLGAVEGLFCVPPVFPGTCTTLPDCTTAADCASGSVCVLASTTCCGRNVCWPLSGAGTTCANPGAPAGVFRRAARPAVEGRKRDGIADDDLPLRVPGLNA